MAVTPAPPAPEASTASKTMADLFVLAAAKRPESPSLRHKHGGEWHVVTTSEALAAIDEIALGLIEVGVAPGERVSILANTRIEWTYCDFAIARAGAVVVPIYQTNSPDECAWVLGDSGAVAVICEDGEQLAKVRAVQDRLPDLRTIVVIEPGDDVATADGAGDAITLDELRARGRDGDRDELETRTAAVEPEDPFTIIYTSGTTGPPKGCVLTHGNYRSVLNMTEQTGGVASDEVVYLYLPLAHSFALLVQLVAIDLGGCIAYFGGDTKQIIAELSEVRPTYLPSVPRIFEKIYTLVTANAEPGELAAAIRVGLEARRCEAAGEELPEEMRAAYDEADQRLFANVRAAFGGRLRQAITGAAPIAKEILEFFHACGVPVFEGYGMTETATVATISTLENHRFGTVGRPLPGVEVKIADDGEVLLRGANIFAGYHNRADESFGAKVDGWLHTGDLGSLDSDGYLSITGRKKDLIITAGGKNLTPANIENDLKRSRWISQAMMHGDRRPYPVALITLDEEEIVPWAKERGLPTDIPSLAAHPDVIALIQGELDGANAAYARVEQVKRFFILDHDLSQETGELTPTLKVKRNVVNEKFAARFDALYA